MVYLPITFTVSRINLMTCVLLSIRIVSYYHLSANVGLSTFLSHLFHLPQTMSVEEIMQQVREIYGDDSLAMLEDEDTDADPVLQGADRVSFIDVSRFWNSVS